LGKGRWEKEAGKKVEEGRGVARTWALTLAKPDRGRARRKKEEKPGDETVVAAEGGGNFERWKTTRSASRIA